MFRLKTELLPPPSLIEEIIIADELLLCTINRWVTDPTLVNIVSKKTVSVEKVSLYAEFELILSCFLQDEMIINVKITIGIRLILLTLLNILSIFGCKCRKNMGCRMVNVKRTEYRIFAFCNSEGNLDNDLKIN
jgi:hypothetical protein